jgi:hypothetical protein
VGSDIDVSVQELCKSIGADHARREVTLVFNTILPFRERRIPVDPGHSAEAIQDLRSRLLRRRGIESKQSSEPSVPRRSPRENRVDHEKMSRG